MCIRFVETSQPAAYADGLDTDADPNGPPTVVVGNDRLRQRPVLSPFPVRGPFNFGELRSQQLGLVKLTNGTNNSSGTGPLLPVGSTVPWTYLATNTGNVPLTGVTVSDNQPGVGPVYLLGDANGNGLLDPGETWVYTATGLATAGQYTNTGSAFGWDITGITLTPITASDGDRYFGNFPSSSRSSSGRWISWARSYWRGGKATGEPDVLRQRAVPRRARSTVDTAGVSYWVGWMQAGFTQQAQVAMAVWQSPEHRGLQVDALYRALLHWPADATRGPTGRGSSWPVRARSRSPPGSWPHPGAPRRTDAPRSWAGCTPTC